MTELFDFPSLRAPKFPSLALPARLHGLTAVWAVPLFFAAPSLATIPVALVLLLSLPSMVGLARGAWQCWLLPFAQLLAFAVAITEIAPEDLDLFATCGAAVHLVVVALACSGDTVLALVRSPVRR